MKEQFKAYLTEKGYSVTTPAGNPSTVYDYVKRVDKVCEWENTTWTGLAGNINITHASNIINAREECLIVPLVIAIWFIPILKNIKEELMINKYHGFITRALIHALECDERTATEVLEKIFTSFNIRIDKKIGFDKDAVKE